MLAAATFNFLAALPAVLGFTGFMVYLVVRSRRPPSPVVMKILEHLGQRSGQLPKLDKRLSGKAVHRLLTENEELRSALPESEMKLLNEIRKDEQRENRLVFAFLSFALLVSLVLYVVLEWRPWQEEVLRPISEVIYNVQLSTAVTPDCQAGFEMLKAQMGGLLAQAQGESNPQKWLADQGLLFESRTGAEATQIDSYQVTLLPGAKFAANLAQLPQPDIPGSFRSLLLIIKVVENDERAIQGALTDPQAPSLWADTLMASVASPYMPFALKLDFSARKIWFSLNNVKPFQPRVTQSVKYWNDFKNHAIVVLPAMLAESNLERFEIWSSIGPEQPAESLRLEKRIRVVEGERQEYFVYR